MEQQEVVNNINSVSPLLFAEDQQSHEENQKTLLLNEVRKWIAFQKDIAEAEKTLADLMTQVIELEEKYGSEKVQAGIFNSFMLGIQNITPITSVVPASEQGVQQLKRHRDTRDVTKEEYERALKAYEEEKVLAHKRRLLVIILLYEGWSQQEIAQRLDTSIQNVSYLKQKFRRGLMKKFYGNATLEKPRDLKSLVASVEEERNERKKTVV